MRRRETANRRLGVEERELDADDAEPEPPLAMLLLSMAALRPLLLLLSRRTCFRYQRPSSPFFLQASTLKGDALKDLQVQLDNLLLAIHVCN